MKKIWKRGALPLATVALLTMLAPGAVEAQSRGNPGGGAPQVELSVEVRTQVRDFYAQRGPTGAEALPPGIRRRLERGKPLPPGIAKKVAPPALMGRLALPRGFELVEVGLDVLLVEVATSVVHDVLMDVIR
ncbi:MAG TPA: anti-virulence regulator CigR family protein [Longimicrobiales bacterium]|nr:anti-virulence regulator CigR family protein [Longimicrobiales bacterium]